MVTGHLLLLAFVPTGAASFAPSRALPSPRLLANARPRLLHELKNCSDPEKRVRTNDEISRESTIDHNNRRWLLSSFAASAVLGAPASEVWAAQGAAEYDLEYYARDLFFGNAPEGNRPASTAPVPPPPRALRGPLLALLLDDGLQSCIPVQELAKVTNVPTTTLAEQIDVFRSKVQTAFRVNHPWKVENVQDGYYFDLTCYALWRTAAAAIPKDYSQRDIFQRNVGRQLLNEIIGRDIAQKTTIDVLDGSNAKALALTDSVPCIIDILDLFQSANYCTSYRLGDKNDGERTGRHVFDRFDDEELSSGGSVDCLVSVLDPATLGGALQITGEGSRFAPDFLGPTLAAVWERAGGPGVVVSFESYFVDPVYRPNPKDFFPNERLYQFTIAGK